ncbi:MAG: methyltransferase domain-containing protein [Pseudomonadota bacterium]
MNSSYFAVFASLMLVSCSAQDAGKASTEPAAAAVDASVLLDAALNGPARSDDDRARDVWRHPRETLQFFGVEPSMTVVEIWPGGGWYTRILAPYLKSGGGVYYAAQVDPSASDRAAAAVDRFRSDFSNADLFGEIKITTLDTGGIAPENSADAVLTFRNVHNWLSSGKAEDNFKAFYRALKPGGVLGVVEHRANEGAGEEDPSSGYVRESTVKALAEAAGFEFAGASEINANPKDTKDHPFGVWTLPPVRRSSASSGQEDPDFDRAKYDAIGESDRMTLKFVKPQQ